MKASNFKSFITMSFVAILIFGLVIYVVERSRLEPEESVVMQETTVEEVEIESEVEIPKETERTAKTETEEESKKEKEKAVQKESVPEPDDGSNALYEKGKELFKQGLYVEAIEELTMINEEGKYYAKSREVLSEAIEAYRQETHAEADKLIAEGRRDEAIRALRELVSRVGENEETSQKLKENIDIYKKELLASIDTTYDTGGCDEVIELLTDGNMVLCDDFEVKTELDKWKKRKTPTYLSDLEYFSKGESLCEDSSEWALTDNYDNTYRSGIDQSYMRWVLEGVDDIEYYLGGEYAKFSGTVYVTKDARFVQEGYYTWDYACIEIYADDVLMATYTGFHPKTEPIDFDVDVRDVEFLRIRFTGCYYTDEGWDEPLVVLGNGRVGW